MKSCVLGVGMTRFTRHPDRTPASLAVEAAAAALNDAGAAWSEVDAVFVGSAFLHQGVGQRLLMGTPLLGKPIVNLENACASGATGFRDALAWIEAGFCGTALAIGIENLSQLDTVIAPPAEDLAGYLGATAATAYALKARRYMDEYGVTERDMAAVAVKSRAHAHENPDAHFRDKTTIEEVLASPMIADPLTRLQCCPNVDGAAAVFLAAGDQVRRFRGSPIRVLASSMVSGRRRDHQEAAWDVTKRASAAAYEQAGLGPQDMDLIEVHDAFTIGEIVHYEDLGLCPKGEGGRYASSGRSTIGGGGIPVNPSGGLISRGHPLGASGLAQIVEIARQIRGQAGKRQIEGARTGLGHIMGGNVSELDSNACLVHIFQG